MPFAICNSPFTIRPFKPSDQAPVRRLILAGLGEHFGWIDETRNPDLDDITTHYIARGNTFLVAENNGEIVGTGALIAESENTGRIVRMSVSRMCRREGIGRALVKHLLDVARQEGFIQVRVSTEPDWQDAIGLYKHCDFTEYKHDEIGAYFSLALDE
ncbi:MAG: GNAT family N-acetyltransferase [Chloroflexi bacterium]|nr:GNAT family N-acetyltransferase [Chloroflexota bacterium]